MRSTAAVSVLLATTLVTLGACDRVRPGGAAQAELPPVDSVEALYAEQGVRALLSFDGRTLEIRARQEREQLRRGGTLWARVGPYIYVFAPATQQAMDRWTGINAVRVITSTEDGREIARATLRRGRLSDVLWRRSLNIHGRAVTEGSERPRLLEELVAWGEDYTDYRYDPSFVPQ